MARKTTNPMSVRQSIVAVLAERGKPMKVRQIIDAGLPLTSVKGKTPGQQFYSILYTEAKKGSASKFERVDRGTFRLRKVRAAKTEKVEAEENPTA